MSKKPITKKPIISTTNLCKSYSTGTEQFHAIRNISLDIYEGDFTVIMGNSGSGKSTLLYLLSGLDSITSGEVCFRESRIDRYDAKALSQFRTHQIGYIYQSSNLVPDLTLLENVILPGFIAGKPKLEVTARGHALLEQLGIEQQQHRLPAQLSGGQQQRAAIARALMNTPDVIFADEPTGSLNYEHGVAVLNILTEMNKQGQTVVMVTHDMKAACRADRLIYIQDGKIGGVLEFNKFDPQQIQEREAHIFSFVTGKE